LLAAVLLLCLAGLVMVYSSSAILAQSEQLPETEYLRSQTEKLVLGLALMFMLSRLPGHWFAARAAWGALGISAALLMLLLLPTGLTVMVRGTRRFLQFGPVQTQPAEVARLGIVLFLAWFCGRRPEWIRQSWKSLIVPLAVIGILSMLIVLQPNLSSALLLGLLGFGVLFFSGQPLRRLAAVVLPLGLAAALFVRGYQLERLSSFWRVLFGDAGALPYQVKQSLIAIGSGGFHGAGIGRGLQKFHYLPFPFSDSILGIIGEETGFIGILALYTLYGIVLLRGFRIARLAPDRFSGLLAAGLTMNVGLNVFLHSVVALGLGPVTGVPLPFVSHGGSSLLVNLAGMGILLSISRRARPDLETAARTWKFAGSPLRNE